MTDRPEKQLVTQEAVSLARTMTFEMSVYDIADAFCRMSDDGQARFFAAVARIMDAYEGAGKHMQVCYIGHHLRDCECIDDAAREWVADLYHFMTTPRSET